MAHPLCSQAFTRSPASGREHLPTGPNRLDRQIAAAPVAPLEGHAPLASFAHLGYSQSDFHQICQEVLALKRLAIAFAVVLCLFTVSAMAAEWTGYISDAKCGAYGNSD